MDVDCYSTKKSGRAIGLILARGGSKGIRLKNVKLLAGRPLLYWSMHALRDSGVVDEVWVSTDHDEIERIARDGGALVHRRSPEVSKDSTSSLESVMEFLNVQQPQCDIIVRTQATCPCVRPEHFTDLMAKYHAFGYDSMFSVVRLHLFRWQEVSPGERTRAVMFDPNNRPRRQDWSGELYENGAIYVTRTELLKRGIRQGGKAGYYEMPAHLFVDIDVPDDWPLAEDRVRKYGYNPDTKHVSNNTEEDLVDKTDLPMGKTEA